MHGHRLDLIGRNHPRLLVDTRSLFQEQVKVWQVETLSVGR